MINRVLWCLFIFSFNGTLLGQHWYGLTNETFNDSTFIKDTCLFEFDSLKVDKKPSFYWVFQPYGDSLDTERYYLDFKKIDSIEIQSGFYDKQKYMSQNVTYILNPESNCFELSGYSTDKEGYMIQNRLKSVILFFLYEKIIKSSDESDGEINVSSNGNDTIITLYYSKPNKKVFSESLFSHSNKSNSCLKLLLKY